MSSKVGCFNRIVFYEFCYGLHAMISMIGPGMSIGYSSIALPMLTSNKTENIDSSYLYDDQEMATWFASIIAIAALIGCLVSGFTMNIGRKFSIILVGVTCAAGWLIIATSHGIIQLLFGRFVTGFATGLVSTPPVVYLAEISIPQHRIIMTTSSTLCITIGIMLIYLLGFVIPGNWRLIAFLSAIIPILSAFFTAICIPESPIWLLHLGQEEKARKSLLQLRGLKKETPQFKEEFEQMAAYSKKKEKIQTITITESIGGIEFADTAEKSSIFFDFLTKIRRVIRTSRRPDVWKPFLILNSFFFFQQFCGIAVITAYAVDFVSRSGVTADPFLITTLIGILQTISSAILVVMSSRLGTRPISISSGIGMAISLGVIATYLQFIEGGDANYPAIPIIALFVFVLTGQLGFAAIPWSMLGEIYPTKFVNILGPATTCFYGLFNFITLQIYPSLVNFGMISTVFIYCITTIIATIFVALFLPETRGKTNHEIEARFRKK